ncbi:unnamed protein product [Rotaria sordida]|uniref:Uncharacterized protein n=1 Tax=Rotaria sordida TaxID=392033 RepID=A0A814GNQ4_9BILA|nr:unnamed protein product [Rotaria sordida]CAF1080716.1 unnamed protein product [Rotaria sordida]
MSSSQLTTLRLDQQLSSIGKKDTITIKENAIKKLQKRYLLFLTEMNQMFIEENPETKVGLSSFQDLRPRKVLYKSSTLHHVYVCSYHENIVLLLKSFNEHVHRLKSIDWNSFIKLIVCDDTNE